MILNVLWLVQITYFLCGVGDAAQPQNTPSSSICGICDKTNTRLDLYTLTRSSPPINTCLRFSCGFVVVATFCLLFCIDFMKCNHNLKWDLLYWCCLHPTCVKSKSKQTVQCFQAHSQMKLSKVRKLCWPLLRHCRLQQEEIVQHLCVTAVLDSFIHLSCSSSFAQRWLWFNVFYCKTLHSGFCAPHSWTLLIVCWGVGRVGLTRWPSVCSLEEKPLGLCVWKGEVRCRQAMGCCSVTQRHTGTDEVGPDEIELLEINNAG